MIAPFIPTTVRELPDRWRRRVDERRSLSRTDPAADALETAAAELERELAAAQDTSRVVSTREYAALHHLRDGTVRKWCARGLLPGARKNAADDWEIPVMATRIRRRRA